MYQSGKLLTSQMDHTSFGAGAFSLQGLVDSWKAGPRECMTVENKQTTPSELFPPLFKALRFMKINRGLAVIIVGPQMHSTMCTLHHCTVSQTGFSTL